MLLPNARTSWAFGAERARIVGPRDTLTYLAAGAVLIVASIVASLSSARRAASVDPVIALRAD